MAELGTCDVAGNGQEAIQAFEAAWAAQEPYGLICLDIMMPGMDGHKVLQIIRQEEMAKAVPEEDAVKVIMTTALSDHRIIMRAFKEQCEAYLIKPIDKQRLLETIQQLGLS